jgi:hypothetical protein
MFVHKRNNNTDAHAYAYSLFVLTKNWFDSFNMSSKRDVMQLNYAIRAYQFPEAGNPDRMVEGRLYHEVELAPEPEPTRFVQEMESREQRDARLARREQAFVPNDSVFASKVIASRTIMDNGAVHMGWMMWTTHPVFPILMLELNPVRMDEDGLLLPTVRSLSDKTLGGAVWTAALGVPRSKYNTHNFYAWLAAASCVKVYEGEHQRTVNEWCSRAVRTCLVKDGRGGVKHRTYHLTKASCWHFAKALQRREEGAWKKAPSLKGKAPFYRCVDE